MKNILVTILAALTLASVSAKANDPVFTVWAVTQITIMVTDAVMTGIKLPTCETAKQENTSAYTLTHGGWGNGNVNGNNLKTCTE